MFMCLLCPGFYGIPTEEIYVLFMSTEVFYTSVPTLFIWHTVPNFCWALSNQKGMSYLAKKKSLTKRGYTDHKFSKKCKVAL